MERLGAVDIGTNSTRLLLADVGDGRIHERRRELRITRLGEGVDASGVLAEPAIARVLAVLVTYATLAAADGVERVRATATSAVRDARNGGAFLERVRAETGLDVVLLSGHEEASATVAGVLSDRPTEDQLVVVDVGGGSTELARVRDRRLDGSTSLQLGCVRTTERWLGEGRIGAAAIDEARAAIRAVLASEAAGLRGTSVVAVAGTAITAAAVDLGVEAIDVVAIHGHVVEAALIDALIEQLAPLTVAQRAALPGIEAGRAPVIVGGLVVLAEVLRHLGASAFRVSDRDILHGTVLKIARAVP